VIFNYFACENTITGDPWFKTRSHICSASRSVNLRFAELNRIRTKWLLDRGSSVTLGGTDIKAVRRRE
jgi:hypothetical protein